MKIRHSFVSNSSSSSFVISLDDISAKQLYLILNHIEIAMNMKGMEQEFWDEHDKWTTYIDENTDEIYGSTGMTNFSMYKFLKQIGVAEEKVVWDQERH